MSLSRHLAGCSVLSQAERSGRGIVTIAAKPEEDSQRRWALASASRARRRLQAPQRLQKLRTAVVVEFDRQRRDELRAGWLALVERSGTSLPRMAGICTSPTLGLDLNTGGGERFWHGAGELKLERGREICL